MWNLSERQLTVTVDRQTRAIPRGKHLAIEVPREFTWQIEGRASQIERIAAGESALTIVIRRLQLP
jgi:hypothetical protein